MQDQFDAHSRDIGGLLATTREHSLSITQLWKEKVNFDRYIWVERFVMACVGALLMYAFQQITHTTISP